MFSFSSNSHSAQQQGSAAAAAAAAAALAATSACIFLAAFFHFLQIFGLTPRSASSQHAFRLPAAALHLGGADFSALPLASFPVPCGVESMGGAQAPSLPHPVVDIIAIFFPTAGLTICMFFKQIETTQL